MVVGATSVVFFCSVRTVTGLFHGHRTVEGCSLISPFAVSRDERAGVSFPIFLSFHCAFRSMASRPEASRRNADGSSPFCCSMTDWRGHGLESLDSWTLRNRSDWSAFSDDVTRSIDEHGTPRVSTLRRFSIALIG